MKKYKLSKSKINDLTKELRNRLEVLRPRILEELKYAADQGDFVRENFPYEAAKEKRDYNESRIEEIQLILKNHEIIDASTSNVKKVQVGVRVKVRWQEKLERILHLVDELEANSLENKISVISPIGRVLLNKAQGEEVCAIVNQKEIRLLILEIQPE